MKAALLMAGLLALGAPAMAAQSASELSTDPRVQQIVHEPGEVLPLQVAPGYQLTLGFASQERIESVAVGNADAWQVTPNKRGDYLFIKLLAAASPTNMTVITDGGVYAFDLVPASPGGVTPYVVIIASRPAAPTTAPPQAAATVISAGKYRLGGSRAVRPTQVSDDGRQTFVTFGERAVLPAVYGIDDAGEEVLVNGEMIGGRYVLDQVYDRLVLRLGRQSATASRSSKLGAKPR